MNFTFRSILWFHLVIRFMMPITAFAEELDDAEETKSKFDRDFDKSVGKLFSSGNNPTDKRAETANRLLSDPSVSAYDKYLVKRTLIFFNVDLKHCETMSILPDDFEIQATCVQASSRSPKEKKIELEKIFENAVKSTKNSVVPAWIGTTLIYRYGMTNDIAAARKVYQKVLDVTPKSARWSLANLKYTLAILYGKTNNGPEVNSQALALNNELIDLLQNDPPSEYFYKIILYNRASLHLFAFEDYESAIRDLQKTTSDDLFWVNTRVYLAFALSQLGRKMESREILKNLSIKGNTQPEIHPLLKCYIDLTLFEIGERNDLKTCVNVPTETQSDSVLDLTKKLSQMPLGPDVELAMWRQFWRFYNDSLVPQRYAQIQDQVDAMELERAKSESQIKDLELKNYQTLKWLFGILLVMFAAGIVGFWRFRLKNQRIMALKAEAVLVKHKLDMQTNLIREWELRNAMAARTAHHINNPLNAVLGLKSIVQSTNDRLRSRFETMLPPPGKRSKEALEVERVFSEDFSEIDKTLASMETSLLRAHHVVKELHHMSGANGFNIERVRLNSVWEEIGKGFRADELLLARNVTWINANASPDAEAFGDSNLITGAIFYLLKEMVEESTGGNSINLKLALGDQREDFMSFHILISGCHLPEKAWREYALSSHILESFGGNLSVMNRNGLCEGIAIDLDTTGTITERLQSTSSAA